MVRNSAELDGKTVVVSGAAGGGIGTAITAMCARAGATVVAADIDAEKLERDIAPLIAEGLAIVPVVADALSETGVEAIMDYARDAEGELHGLVTVVGGGPPETWGSTLRLSREHWRSQIALNLDSMFFMSQAFVAELKAQRRPGAIVAISSICGLTASPYNAGYGAGKAALLSVVQSLGLELARDGIRVNAVAPGATRTPTAHLTEDAERVKRGVPMGRFGSPDEIAAPALFLLSDMSSYMTGQCLVADGGCNIKWCHLSDENVPMFLKPESAEKARQWD